VIGSKPDERWLDVLAHLDELRSRALRLDDPAILRSVYVDGSDALHADRALVLAYRARDLRLLARVAYLSADLVRRRADRVRLAVVDQLRSAVVATASGSVVTLPADQPTSHTIVLRRTGEGWLIAAISAIAG
jgi:hypothetical protein